MPSPGQGRCPYLFLAGGTCPPLRVGTTEAIGLHDLGLRQHSELHTVRPLSIVPLYRPAVASIMWHLHRFKVREVTGVNKPNMFADSTQASTERVSLACA